MTRATTSRHVFIHGNTMLSCKKVYDTVWAPDQSKDHNNTLYTSSGYYRVSGGSFNTTIMPCQASRCCYSIAFSGAVQGSLVSCAKHTLKPRPYSTSLPACMQEVDRTLHMPYRTAVLITITNIICTRSGCTEKGFQPEPANRACPLVRSVGL